MCTMFHRQQSDSTSYQRHWQVIIFIVMSVVCRTISFNVDCEVNNSMVMSSNYYQNTSSYFGYSFTIRKEKLLQHARSTFLTRLLIGAPESHRTYLTKNFYSSVKADDNIHECLIDFKRFAEFNNSEGGYRNFLRVCRKVSPFVADHEAVDSHLLTSIDATGLSADTMEKENRFSQEEGGEKTDRRSHWIDTVCRPLHSHRCGSAYKYEGGCYLAGVFSAAKSSAHHQTGNISIPKYPEKMFEVQDLKPAWKIKSPCRTECERFTNIDIMFVIDGSASIKKNNFEIMLTWIQNVSSGFDISEAVRIGVVQYSHWNPLYPLNQQRLIKTEISLGEYNDTTKYNSAVAAIKYQRSSTYTAHAINKTVMYDFNGPNGRYPRAGRVMILLTDGRSTDGKLLPKSAIYAMEEGVVSYAVGVGHAFVPEELRIIAGSEERVFEVAKFSALDDIVRGLQQSISQSLEGEPSNKTNELIHCQAGISSDLNEGDKIKVEPPQPSCDRA